MNNQDYSRYNLSPSYEYQEKPWLAHFKRKRRISFKVISWTMLLGSSIFNKLIKQRKKVTILYGTETGQSNIQISKIRYLNIEGDNPVRDRDGPVQYSNI